MLLFYQVLDQAEDYDEALKMFADSPTASPVYVLLGGLELPQAAVILKDIGETGTAVVKMGNSTLHNQPG